ncbi:MAG TPA: GGDEF domain-containing protein [Candidatus Nitrosocosmicus sp.]|jgi:diguanylate cyclase (GGDEF)-like protein|nr:GGDEF domain-containing protein [Candidatus Nitrosocosmicus sp.]
MGTVTSPRFWTGAVGLAAAAIVALAGLFLLLELELRPLLAPGMGRVALVAAEALVGVVVLLTLTGGLALARKTPARPALEATAAPPETGKMMGSFSRILGEIEEQGNEINTFAQRLENAYKELESSNARLKEFSFKDEVTGLYNRRFFSIRLEEEVSRYRRFSHPVSVMLIDLDAFKDINDELGHGAGDETLRDMADILLKYSRGINVICRYGGDEFAVLLVETSKAGARLYADRIRQVLTTYPFANGRRVTASFGIAALPEDVEPAAEDLIRAADEALYAAKRAGKNRVSVFEDVGAAPLPRRTGRQP